MLCCGRAKWVAALAVVVGLCVGFAEPEAKTEPAPGAMDPAKMMEMYMKAGTPGEMHKVLARSVGTWAGKVTMYGMPGGAVESDCTTVITSMMDGRFTKAETEGMMPGMGPFKGVGIYGYDNGAKQFVSFWIDNSATCFTTGTGELSEDKKTMTWTCHFTDPLTQKPAVMKEIDTWPDANTSVLEMYGTLPDGKEGKIMEIHYVRK